MTVNTALSNNSQFEKRLAFGQMAESYIARWLIRRGCAVLPIYDIEYESGKGPRLFASNRQEAAPDLLVWKGSDATWIEAKHKSVFSWYRKGQRWETGIDLHHWEQYQHVAERTRFPVWLLFLHEQSVPDAGDRLHDCPPKCPVGLFGGTLKRLAGSISHTSYRHGKHGMVYWSRGSLVQVAELDEVIQGEEI